MGKAIKKTQEIASEVVQTTETTEAHSEPTEAPEAMPDPPAVTLDELEGWTWTPPDRRSLRSGRHHRRDRGRRGNRQQADTFTVDV